MAEQSLKAEDGTKFKADGFKLRMICLYWYNLLYYKGEYTGFMSGPQTFAEAEAEAKAWGLIDMDRVPA